MAGISSRELAVQRKQTAAFILADSVAVVLERPTFVSDGAGGHTRGVPTPLPVQTMRLTPLQDGAIAQVTADGEMIEPTYMLIGSWDCDMERWDRFALGGHQYEVVSVNQNTQYQCKGEVVYRE